jgi:hypothetical protein
MDYPQLNSALITLLLVSTFSISIIEITIASVMLTLTRGLIEMFRTIRDGQREQNNLLTYLVQLLRK